MNESSRLKCAWCGTENPGRPATCVACGAPLTDAETVTATGWREAPRLREASEIRMGDSTCQVCGEIAPVAELALGGQDAVYCETRVLLWKEDGVSLTLKPTGAGRNGGMPQKLLEVHGPGRAAFSRDAPGGMVVLPISPDAELDARGGAFVVASATVAYRCQRMDGVKSLFGGGPAYLERFTAASSQGLLVLHGRGCVQERRLADSEVVLVESGALLYKDATVKLKVEHQPLTTGVFGGTGWTLLELSGPGRVGIQSMV